MRYRPFDERSVVLSVDPDGAERLSWVASGWTRRTVPLSFGMFVGVLLLLPLRCAGFPVGAVQFAVALLGAGVADIMRHTVGRRVELLRRGDVVEVRVWRARAARPAEPLRTVPAADLAVQVGTRALPAPRDTASRASVDAVLARWSAWRALPDPPAWTSGLDHDHLVVAGRFGCAPEQPPLRRGGATLVALGTLGFLAYFARLAEVGSAMVSIVELSMSPTLMVCMLIDFVLPNLWIPSLTLRARSGRLDVSQGRRRASLPWDAIRAIEGGGASLRIRTADRTFDVDLSCSPPEDVAGLADDLRARWSAHRRSTAESAPERAALGALRARSAAS